MYVKMVKNMKIALISARCERISRCHSLASTLIELLAVIAITATTFLLTGCGKKTEVPPPAAQPVAQPQVQPAAMPSASQPAAPTPVAPVVTSQGKTNVNQPVNLTALSYAMRPWAMSHGRWPKNFEEFAANPGPGIVIPPPPQGKKYQINNKGRIILVDR